MNPGRYRSVTPSRDDDATKLCPVCRHRFSVVGRGQYCSDGCRKKAWRLRHQTIATPVVVPAPGVSRRSLTIYACQTCETRALGVQRCEDCGAFMTRVGLGGECPCCSEPVAVCELLDRTTVVSWPPAEPPTPAALAVGTLSRTRSQQGGRR